MRRATVPCLVLTLLLPLAAGRAMAQETDGAEGEEAAAPTVTVVPLIVGEVAFTAEIAIVPAPPADIRLLRVDGATMADQGYLVAELAGQGCDQAGYTHDAAVPPTLQTDGSWIVIGGCK